MLLHVEVGGSEVVHPVAKVLGNGERFEEYFRKDYRAPHVEEYPSVTQASDHGGQESKISEGGGADHCAVRFGVLMDNIGAKRNVDRYRNASLNAGNQETVLPDRDFYWR